MGLHPGDGRSAAGWLEATDAATLPYNRTFERPLSNSIISIHVRSATEPRRVVVGSIQQTTWAAFVTYRNEDTIRIISVRRARQKERLRYEAQGKEGERAEGSTG